MNRKCVCVWGGKYWLTLLEKYMFVDFMGAYAYVVSYTWITIIFFLFDISQSYFLKCNREKQYYSKTSLYRIQASEGWESTATTIEGPGTAHEDHNEDWQLQDAMLYWWRTLPRSFHLPFTFPHRLGSNMNPLNRSSANEMPAEILKKAVQTLQSTVTGNRIINVWSVSHLARKVFLFTYTSYMLRCSATVAAT